MDFVEEYEERMAAFYVPGDLPREQVDYAALAERLGEAALRDRIQRQMVYVETLIGHGRGLLRYGPLLDRFHLLELSLRLARLLERGLHNAGRPQLETNEVILPALPTELDGYRMLHLSDLHFEFDLAFTPRLIEAVESLEVDLCVITGDYRYKTHGPHERSMRELAKVVEALQVPVFAVLGNHDAIEMAQGCEAMGVQLLLNEGFTVDHGGASFFLAGVDDEHYYRAADLNRALHARSEDGEMTVLLAHSTEIFSEALTRNVDLMLSGHTHGGQICLPGGLPVLNNARAPRSMLAGAWKYGEMQGYTSRGSGCVSTPVRYNCPPEITVHTLRSLG